MHYIKEIFGNLQANQKSAISLLIGYYISEPSEHDLSEDGISPDAFILNTKKLIEFAANWNPQISYVRFSKQWIETIEPLIFKSFLNALYTKMKFIQFSFKFYMLDGVDMVLSAVDRTQTSIDLENNGLADVPIDVIIKVIRGHPEHITHLNVANNLLFLLPMETLQELFAKIPLPIISIDAQRNDLEHLDVFYQIELLNIIGPHIQNFLIQKNMTSKLLQFQIYTMFLNAEQHPFFFGNYDSLYMLYESELPKHIHYLENLNTPIADFACAQLLSGKMSMVAQEQGTLKDYGRFITNQMNLAVDFYVKAGRCTYFKKLVDQLLWEMKVSSMYLLVPVQKRLAGFAVPIPSEIFFAQNSHIGRAPKVVSDESDEIPALSITRDAFFFSKKRIIELDEDLSSVKTFKETGDERLRVL